MHRYLLCPPPETPVLSRFDTDSRYGSSDFDTCLRIIHHLAFRHRCQTITTVSPRAPARPRRSAPILIPVSEPHALEYLSFSAAYRHACVTP